MSKVNFEAKDSESREDGNFFRVVSKEVSPKIRVRIDGEGVRQVEQESATSVIAIVEDEDGIVVYFRGNFVPNDPLVIDSPLDWLWYLAHHLTVIMKRLRGDESESTYEDAKTTLTNALLMPEIMGDDKYRQD